MQLKMSLQKRDTYLGETSITDRQQIGMKLPAAEQALVEREKVVGYLLNAGQVAPRLITAYPLELL